MENINITSQIAMEKRGIISILLNYKLRQVASIRLYGFVSKYKYVERRERRNFLTL